MTVQRSVMAQRPGIDLRTTSATASGTFGELLQGVLPGISGDHGVDFLVTLPITLRSHVCFRLEPEAPLVVYPSHKRKSAQVARRMLAAAGVSGGTLVIDSAIPTGKGLASSSADLVATVRAIGGCLGLDTSEAATEEWIRSIEPTDGVMYRDVVAFDHRDVRLRAVLGPVPTLTVVAVDEGGRVDTVRFNAHREPFGPAEQEEYADLLAELTTAMAAHDLAAVGRVATASAVRNQARNPKRTLAEMLAVNAEVGGLGVACTHSGTMLGILLAVDDPDYAPRLAAAREACGRIPGRQHVYRTHDDTDGEGTA